MPGMNCRNFEGALVEFARSGAQGMDPRAGLASHLEICDACRSALDAQVRLSAAARVLRAEAGRFEAPSSVERALLGALDSRRRSQRRRFVGGCVVGDAALRAECGCRPHGSRCRSRGSGFTASAADRTDCTETPSQSVPARGRAGTAVHRDSIYAAAGALRAGGNQAYGRAGRGADCRRISDEHDGSRRTRAGGCSGGAGWPCAGDPADSVFDFELTGRETNHEEANPDRCRRSFRRDRATGTK